jgi:hypothetical protein
MKYFLRKKGIIFCLFLLFALSPTPVQGGVEADSQTNVPAITVVSVPIYEITAAYNEKKHTIEGTERITFTNTGETALSEITLFLYPNFYQEKILNSNQKNKIQLAYPVTFNPGGIEILSILDPEGNKLVSADFFGVKTLAEVRLSVPIPPKATYSLLIQFVTQIPERYGVFGYFRDWVTLQGGWHPYLPPLVNGQWDLHGLPPPAQFYVELSVPKDMTVIASAPLGKKRETQTVVPPVPFFSLSIGRELIQQDQHSNGSHVVYTYSKRNKQYGEQVVETAESAFSFFLLDAGLRPSMEIQMTQAFLYKDIVTTGSRLLYVDSRLFKVFPSLKKYHEMRLAKGVFSLLWQEILPWEGPWAIELMASITAEQFAKQRYPNASGLKTGLAPIAFLPLVDQILYANDPILRQVYFKKTASENETILSFHQPILPHYERLKKILSPEGLESVVTDYKQRIKRGERPELKNLLLDQNVPAIKQFFEKEFLSQGSVDFGIERILRRKIGEEYQTIIDIKKEGLGVEPVEIILYKKDGTNIPLLWNGEEKNYKTIVTTPSPITVVEIDKDELTSDIYRGNNRDPEKWKFLLKRINLGYDLTTHFIDYDIGLQFQPVYSTKNRINLDFSHSEPQDVGSIRYSRELSNKHVLTTGLSYQSPHAIPGLVLDEDVKAINLSYALIYPYIPFVQKPMEWLTGRYPQWGITFGLDKSLSGNSSDYMFNAVFDLSRSFVFSNYHQVHTRLMTGVSTGGLLKNNRFFLGGENGLRGYTLLRFGGESINLFSLEYRFPLLYETDINLSGLALTHTLQGVLFSDWGTVSDRSDLFNLPEYKVGVGGGVRWFVDFLGVVPITFGFDVAWPIHSKEVKEDKPHYYIKGTRLF